MKSNYLSFALAVLASLCVAGCFNMPTPSSQITGSYISPHKYRGYNCQDLTVEASSLARRENMLVIAQEQRLKSSQAQAFWVGYGQGDGIEAVELANVRGEKEAIANVMGRKGCDVPAGLLKPVQPPGETGTMETAGWPE